MDSRCIFPFLISAIKEKLRFIGKGSFETMQPLIIILHLNILLIFTSHNGSTLNNQTDQIHE